MKSLKTFNLDIDVIRILASKPNKSQFVCRAVRKLDDSNREIDAYTYTEKQLLAWLSVRIDFDDPLRPLIIDRINKISGNRE